MEGSVSDNGGKRRKLLTNYVLIAAINLTHLRSIVAA
jgi:hypothetical protein